MPKKIDAPVLSEMFLLIFILQIFNVKWIFRGKEIRGFQRKEWQM
jgi:hypothetical protein